jgi:hypothetical protein
MLPKLEIATFETTLPILKKTIKYRPYTVREEKILLIAAQSDDNIDMVNAITQVVQNCLVDDIDVQTLHIFDIEYMLMKLRAISSSDVIELHYLDHEDNQKYKVTASIDEILKYSVENIKIIDPKIQLTSALGIVMKPLTINLFMNGNLEDLDDPDKAYSVIKNMVEYIYDENETYNINDSSEEEFTEFMDSLTREPSQKISEYFTNIPKLHYTFKYTNSKGTERESFVEGLANFFQ